MLHTHPAWVSSVLLTCPRPKPAIPLSSSTGPSHPLRAVPRIGEGKLLVWGQNSCYIVLFLFRPMRMSYSAITDPCLSEEVVSSVDKVINFYKKQVHHFTKDFFRWMQYCLTYFPQEKQVPLCSEWREGKYYFEKIGSSLLSKFPQDQDEQLWR